MQLSKSKIFAALVLLALGAFLVWRFFLSSTPALAQREIATRVLAEYIQARLKPRSVLVVGNPFAQTAGRSQQIYTYQNAGVEGLRKGFSPAVQVNIAFPALKPEVLRDPSSIPVDSNSKTPLSFLVTENAFDQLTSQHSKSDIIISLIGLPVNLQAVESWTKPAPPHFGFLLPDWRMIGPPEQILQAFKSGKLAAAVVEKPGAPPEEKIAGKDFRAAFESSFLLVTADNIEQLLSTQPQLFGLP